MKAPARILIFFFCKEMFFEVWCKFANCGPQYRLLDGMDGWLDRCLDVFFFVFSWFGFIFLIKDNGFFPPFNPLLEKIFAHQDRVLGTFLGCCKVQALQLHMEELSTPSASGHGRYWSNISLYRDPIVLVFFWKKHGSFLVEETSFLFGKPFSTLMIMEGRLT